MNRRKLQLPSWLKPVIYGWEAGRNKKDNLYWFVSVIDCFIPLLSAEVSWRAFMMTNSIRWKVEHIFLNVYWRFLLVSMLHTLKTICWIVKDIQWSMQPAGFWTNDLPIFSPTPQPLYQQKLPDLLDTYPYSKAWCQGKRYTINYECLENSYDKIKY